MIAALFVADDGPYIAREGVEPWTIARDAREYPGPAPVIAHPPCERWGRYWGGGPSVKVKRRLGADAGCFYSALLAVRDFGGVLEHPAHSHAWAAFNLPRPKSSGGWTDPDQYGGRACHVEQGHYGHRARKATWLYAVRTAAPPLIWGPSTGERLDEGFHSREERLAARAAGVKPRKRLSKAECVHTPSAFADLLIEIARSAVAE